MTHNRYQQYRQAWNDAIVKTPEYPIHIDAELASYCNSKCIFCPHSDEILRFKLGFMREELVYKLLDDISGKALSIKFNFRGESTLHPKFNEIMRYARSKDLVDRMLNSNGNFPVSKLEGVYQLDTMIFSIDSLIPEKYEKIRVRLKWDILMARFNETYQHFLKHGTPKIRINVTIQSTNKDEIEDFKLFATKYPGVEVRFAPVFERTQEGDDYRLTSQDIEVSGRANCGYPFRRLMITHDGWTIPCCPPWDAPNTDILLGRYPEQSIEQLWTCQKIKDVRKAVSTNNHQVFKECLNCSSWSSYIVKFQNKTGRESIHRAS